MTYNTPVTIMEQDTRNMNPMHKSLSSPGLLGIPLSYQERRLDYSAEVLDEVIGRERIPEHRRVEPLLADYVNIP